MQSLKKYVQLLRKMSEAASEATGKDYRFVVTVVDHREHSSYDYEAYSLKILEILNATEVVSESWIELSNDFDEAELEGAVNTWIADMVAMSYYAAQQKDEG